MAVPGEVRWVANPRPAAAIAASAPASSSVLPVASPDQDRRHARRPVTTTQTAAARPRTSNGIPPASASCSGHACGESRTVVVPRVVPPAGSYVCVTASMKPLGPTPKSGCAAMTSPAARQI